jgi:type II secretory pathway predicted ATPase ExeA
LTYEPHFGLHEKPFSLSPNPRFFLRHSSHADAFTALIAGIRRREGILALTGEVGTGKTTLCRSVVESLDRKTFAAFVPDPILSREDLLKTLLVEFGVVSVDDLKSGLRSASRTELSFALYEFLASLQPLKAFAVVMIDEAQNLPASLLEEIRILSDMENREKLLQLVLIGQPELHARLSEPGMRQLAQRLSVRCELKPLAEGDVGPYISHRLGIAGNGDVVFHSDAIQLIYAASVGIPRVINLLCDRALLRAASAGASSVSVEHIVGAAEDLWIPLTRTPKPQLQHPTSLSTAREKPSDAVRRPRTTRQGLPSTYQMRHDAHYVEELEAGRLTAAAAPAVSESARVPPPMPPDPALGKSWLKLASIAAAALVLSAGGVWMLRSSADRFPGVGAIEPPSELTTTRQASAPPSSIPLPAPDSLPASSTANRDEAAAPRFAVQMATFRSEARATESVRELGAAGYQAFSAGVSLRDGGRGFAVFLGPYAERTAADVVLERAELIPGYDVGRVVQLGLANRR